jgi:aryl-alcohol dehydrogenase-like predicted oxidoreductase
MPAGFKETAYGNIIADCAAQGMGVFAIRVFAGGALLGATPSAHTHRTPFFPLALYERDQRRATHIAALLGPTRNLKADALRFVLDHPHVTAALVGCRDPEEIDEAVEWLASGPLTSEIRALLLQASLDVSCESL